MADRKVIDEGGALYDDEDLKIIYDGQVLTLDAGGGSPEPPTDNSVPWMSFF
jgi:hypothetical protein